MEKIFLYYIFYFLYHHTIPFLLLCSSANSLNFTPYQMRLPHWPFCEYEIFYAQILAQSDRCRRMLKLGAPYWHNSAGIALRVAQMGPHGHLKCAAIEVNREENYHPIRESRYQFVNHALGLVKAGWSHLEQTLEGPRNWPCPALVALEHYVDYPCEPNYSYQRCRYRLDEGG